MIPSHLPLKTRCPFLVDLHLRWHHQSKDSFSSPWYFNQQMAATLFLMHFCSYQGTWLPGSLGCFRPDWWAYGQKSTRNGPVTEQAAVKHKEPPLAALSIAFLRIGWLTLRLQMPQKAWLSPTRDIKRCSPMSCVVAAGIKHHQFFIWALLGLCFIHTLPPPCLWNSA